MTSALRGLATSYVTEMLQLYRPSRSLRSVSKKLLMVPIAKLKGYGCWSFSLIAVPKLWNSLPEPARHHDCYSFSIYVFDH